jgi:AraC-like DNA-binding protein/quercetin dioxygenase-like cupin family protein
MINSTFVKNNASGFLYEKHRFVKGNMPKMHYHDYYEIYYLISGERNHFVGDKFLTIKKGDFVVIRPEVPHKTGGLSGARALICFNEDFLSNWLTKSAQTELLSFFDKTFIRPESERQSEILNAINELEKAYFDKDNAKIFSSLLQLILILKKSSVATSENSTATTVLQNAMEYAQKNYATINSLQDVADALFVSKFHLCHLFSKYVEVPFNSYLTKIRLNNATRLLVSSSKTISEVAIDCGFSTATYFCQVFKKEFGVSPLKYKTLKNNK